MRARGFLATRTVALPLTTVSGGPTQTAMLPIPAAGNIPIRTVGAAGMTIGPPTCGTIAVTIGQTCMSVIREAGVPGIYPIFLVEHARPAAMGNFQATTIHCLPGSRQIFLGFTGQQSNGPQ